MTCAFPKKSPWIDVFLTPNNFNLDLSLEKNGTNNNVSLTALYRDYA